LHYLIAVAFFLALLQPALADAVAMPKFRTPDPMAPKPDIVALPEIRLLAEPDFAPWSFTGDDGQLTGISVELARAACTEAGLTCNLVPEAYLSLVPQMQKGQADGVVSGLRIAPGMVGEAALTRPYFRSLGRFMIRDGAPIAAPDPRSLAGKRLGAVAGSLHEAFLKAHYPKAQLVSVTGEAALVEQLRTGALDVAFGDSLHLSFWMNSDGARKCCVALGGGVVDPDTVSRPLVFMLRKDKASVRDRLDLALDRLEDNGTTAAIFARFLPAPIW
jgi:polar amino acid transport system substrate-binding protein